MDGAKKSWTDAEKAGVFFQIIEKAGTIPWDQLELPEGRTVKAVQMMIAKEKKKAKDAKANETGNDDSPNKKRTSDNNDKDGGSPAKKPKTPRKKAVKATTECDDDDESQIKPETKEESFDDGEV